MLENEGENNKKRWGKKVKEQMSQRRVERKRMRD